MITFTLIREKSSLQGTFGTIYDADDNEVCKTVELPWDDNLTDQSCVPVGSYQCTIYQSPKHGQVWMLQGVPNRLYCEIHAANTIDDLEGCIGVGDHFGEIDEMPAVLNSQMTLAMLRKTWPGNFTLTIQEDLA